MREIILWLIVLGIALVLVAQNRYLDAKRIDEGIQECEKFDLTPVFKYKHGLVVRVYCKPKGH